MITFTFWCSDMTVWAMCTGTLGFLHIVSVSVYSWLTLLSGMGDQLGRHPADADMQHKRA